MLTVTHVYFDYPEKQILRDVHFSVNAGALLHLRGDNGVGKTTLLKLLAGLLQPSRGDIQYNGQSIFNNVSAYQQHICYVGHKTGVSPFLTVKEHCFFELQRDHNNPSWHELLALFSLDGLEDVYCHLLSAGQRRRVGLMRLLLSRASLWLLDEPLIALDENAVRLFMSFLTTHLKQGGQVILTSHQPLLHCTEYGEEYCL